MGFGNSKLEIHHVIRIISLRGKWEREIRLFNPGNCRIMA
jgi:hypothetical protein